MKIMQTNARRRLLSRTIANTIQILCRKTAQSHVDFAHRVRLSEAVYLKFETSASLVAFFKWPSKVITWLWLLRFVIGLKESRQFFNPWEAEPKPIAPCTRDFSRASSELQVIARNCDWFMELFVSVVIGRSNCFGFGFSTVIWKPLYITTVKMWPSSTCLITDFKFLSFPCK